MEGWALHIHPEDRKRAVKIHYDAIKAGIPYHEEYRFRRKNGSYFYAEDYGIFFKNKSKHIYRMLGVIKDITERKSAEDALAKAEEIRKKEIHHRIKNNLQVVSSLLELQADKFKDEKVVEAFRESQKRVASMAIIHEELYESKDKDMLTLNFSVYVRKLTAYLLNAYTLESDNIKLELNVEEIAVEMDTAIPLGIIINELVSNSLKHAFGSKKEGELRISFHKLGNDIGKNAGSEKTPRFILRVSDSGKSFPDEIDFKNSDSLGLQLVNTLVDQIGGTIELNKSRGTEFVIKY
jgi:two-component sensor histidine kinase